MDRATCVICTDYLTVADCSACPCGHTFHFQCISSWKQESSTCPQCRTKLTKNKEPIKLFFDQSNETICEGKEEDPSVLKNTISDLKIQLREHKASTDTFEKNIKETKIELSESYQHLADAQGTVQSLRSTNDALKKQLGFLDKYKNESSRSKAEVVALQKNLIAFKNIEDLIKGERQEVEGMLKSFADSPDSHNQMINSFVLLKKEFERTKENKRKLEKERNSYRREADEQKIKTSEVKDQLAIAESDIQHIIEQKKELEAKVQQLEQKQASSQRFKRPLAESQLHWNKRICIDSSPDRDDSRFLFDEDGMEEDGNIHLSREAAKEEDSFVVSEEEEETNEQSDIANEFGLKFVSTTSMAITSKPIKDPSQHRPAMPLKTKQPQALHSGSLLEVRKGYNGLGGHSKLIIPSSRPLTTASTATKPTANKNVSKKVRVPKSKPIKMNMNTLKISKVFPPKHFPGMGSGASSSHTFNTSNHPRLPTMR